MSGQLGHIAATASLDINPFQQSSRVLQTQIKTIDKALKAQELSFKNNSKNINGMKVAYDQTGKSIQSHTALLQQQEKKYNDLKDEIGDINKANANQKTSLLNAEAAMTTTSGKIEELTGKYNNLGKQIAIQESSWTKAGNTLEVIGKKATSVGSTLTGIGNSMTKGLTVPIVGGVALAVKSAIDFESAFAGVKKTVDEVVDTNGNVIISYEDLSAGIREMAKELPASATQISEVAESAGQLGIQTENVLSFSKTMIDMGESTNLGANEAATALAKFANITGMSQDQFSNLGASIVDLGNNFATTESDIVEMAMRLAGAGAQVGLSEADILGLSAALSSVGIEAEMGGSAISKVMVNMAVASKTGLDAVKDLETATGMSRRELELMASLDSKGFKDIAGTLNMTTTEMNKIIKSGKNLEGFSAIAGMTGEQFKKAFEEDAVGALGAFIEGLGTAEEKGTSAIELLDEMGISEVRLRDSLLRAGNASELFAGAVQMSNEAYEENTALTDEANKRYETTESKLKMLKNQVNDVAIEFGGPFVDALRDGLEAATPLIENLGNLANAFSEASPEMQQTIVKTLAFTAAAGPMLKILGKVFTVSGSGIDTISKVSKKIGEMSGTAKASKLALDASSTGMIGTTGSAAKLTAGLGAIAPALLIVGGVLAAGSIAWKLWGEDAVAASERTKKWGSDIGEEADAALTHFQDLSGEASEATDQMSYNVGEGAKKAIEAYGAMGDSLVTDIQETVQESEEVFSELPPKIQEMLKEAFDADNSEQKALVEEIGAIQADITSIYETAMAENRELTESELTLVENYHNRLGELRRESLELSAEEQEAVHEAMQEDLKQFSMSQLSERQKMLNGERDLLQTSYEEQAALIKDKAKNTHEYNEMMKVLDQEHYNDMVDIGKEMVKVWEARGDIPEAEQRRQLEAMGLNYEKIKGILSMEEHAIENSTNNMIVTSEKATAEARKANDTWNGMEFFDKEGKLVTNAVEKIQEASQTEEGWNNLQYIMKHAELDTNSKEAIQDALMANGMWWEMEFPAQFADIETNAGTVANYFLDANGKWEGLSYETKTAILETNSTEQLRQVLIDTGVWENLELSEQEMLMTTNAGQAARTALEAQGLWNLLEPKEKEMVMSSNATEKTIEAVNASFTWNGTNWVRKDIEVKSDAPEKAESGLKAEQKWNGTKWEPKKANVSTNAPETESKLRFANKYHNATTWNPKKALVNTNSPDTQTKLKHANAYFLGTKWNSKNANVNTNADTTRSELKYAYDYFSNIRSGSRTFELVTKYTTTGTASGARIGYAKGTDFHPGGPAILGDGGKHEPYMTPQGDFGISPNIDTLFNLPKGTKVWPSIEKFNSEIPRFATGTSQSDISNTNLMSLMSRLRGNESRPTPVGKSETASESSSQAVISQLIKGQEAIVQTLNKMLSSQGKKVNINLNYTKVGELLIPIIDKGIGENTQYIEGSILM